VTKIYCDIADINTIKKFSKKKIVKGFTTNPSLMRKAGAKNYELYSKEILKICKNKPISFEVFADEQKYFSTSIKNQIMGKQCLR
jgi:transaldolase